MNIVSIITRGDAIGGATVHVRDLSRGFEDAGHRVVVLVGGQGEVTEEFARLGVTYRSLDWLGRAIHPAKDVLAVAELMRVLVQLKPDLVCTHTAKAGFLGRLASALLRIPVLYTPHGWAIGDRISQKSARIFQTLERGAAPLADRIINVSQAEFELARRYRIAPDYKLEVIYNGVPDIAPALRARPALAPPRIVMVARFEPPKDHKTLLAAVALLRDLPWTLELVGSGPQLDETRAAVNVLGLSSRIDFTKTGTCVAGRLALSQVFVLSSRSEGFPLSVLEAMRAGLPVVASDAGGIREAVVDGETGFVVEAENPTALAGCLRLLLHDGSLREKFGSAGRLRYEKYFTFDTMLDRTLKLYHSVLSLRREKIRFVPEAAHDRQ
jgi:glycosyltransferase involved in cell wall biosynthesis